MSASGDTGALELLTTTGPAGEYTLENLRAGNHFLAFVDPTGAHAPRFHPDSPNLPDSTPMLVTAGAPATVDATLPGQTATGTGSALSGTITESGTDNPLAGVNVAVLRTADYKMVRGTVTDGNGQWQVDVAAGDYHVAFVDSTVSHRQEWYDDQPSTGLAAAAVATAPGTADAALDSTIGSLAGTVTDLGTGDPLVEAWVIVIGPDGLAGGVTTAGDGTYRVDGLAAGTYHLAFADPNGGRTQQYWDGRSTFAEADPVTVAAATATTADAALTFP